MWWIISAFIWLFVLWLTHMETVKARNQRIYDEEQRRKQREKLLAPYRK